MSVECYDAVAEEYAARAEQSRISIRSTLNEYLLPLLRHRATFLDIGCAVGVATEEASLAGFTAYGIDISPAMISVAKRDRKAGEFACLDFLDGKFGPYDSILAFAFVHLFPKSQAPSIVKKMYDTLYPGGYLYTGTTVEPQSSEGFEKKDDYPDAPPRYRARYVYGEFDKLVLKSAPFVPITITEHRDAFGKLWRDVLVRRPFLCEYTASGTCREMPKCKDHCEYHDRESS